MVDLVAQFTDGGKFTPRLILDISGPFFIAWADEPDAFDPAIHAREDDDIIDITLDHTEGDFATLSITVRNPRIGLLAPGRKLWAWFSWFDGHAIVPLFFGRLVGVPEQLQAETVRLDFIARPSNYADQQTALAATLKVRPYWDGIWFAPDTRDNPDNVLESRAELWHTDRVTHEVTTSNVINGEDGTLSFDGTVVLYDSVGVTYAQNPLRRVNMTATVSWDQLGNGVIDLTGKLHQLTGGWTINSRTGQGLAADWPKPGASIGGGWAWGNGTFCDIIAGVVDPSIVGAPNADNSGYLDGGFDTGLGQWGIDWGSNPQGGDVKWAYHVTIPMITLRAGLTLAFDTSRRKEEVLTFSLVADVQPVLTLPDDQSALDLTMSSSEVNGLVDGAVPLSDQAARSYFTTDRGTQSLEYLIAVARAHLLTRARAVNVTFAIPFPVAVAVNLSCRKNAVVSDPRLPGVNVGGKISNYKLTMTNGAALGTITIGCTVGRSGEVEAVVGTPDYVEPDYATDIQFYEGRFVLPFAGDVAYEDISGVPPVDDGIDMARLNYTTVVNHFTYSPDTQDMSMQDALDNLFDVTVSDTGQVNAKNTSFDHFDLSLKPLAGGPFSTPYSPQLTELKVPKTIDLEADAA